MDTATFDNWAVEWAVQARQTPEGAVLAGLLIDLATDPRRIHQAHTISVPLGPVARALGVHPSAVCTALHHLSLARLLTWTSDDRPPDEPHLIITLHPPAPAHTAAT
jgi:hypothetical protein